MEVTTDTATTMESTTPGEDEGECGQCVRGFGEA